MLGACTSECIQPTLQLSKTRLIFGKHIARAPSIELPHRRAELRIALRLLERPSPACSHRQNVCSSVKAQILAEEDTARRGGSGAARDGAAQ